MKNNGLDTYKIEWYYGKDTNHREVYGEPELIESFAFDI